MSGAPKAPAKTVARSLDVLETVLAARKPMRLKDVAQACALDMASAHRLLRTLEIKGYLCRTSAERAFGPGHKIRLLAQYLPDAEEIMAQLRPFVAELAERTGQVAHIGLLHRSSVVLSEVALSETARISVAQSPGDREEIYCSAIGKALVAFRPEAETRDLLRTQSYKPRTKFTLTDDAALVRELAEVRGRAIAFDDREGSIDVSCIAAPILDDTGYAVASIGLSMVATSLRGTIHDEADMIRAVQEIASQATGHLAGSEPSR